MVFGGDVVFVLVIFWGVCLVLVVWNIVFVILGRRVF